MNIEAVAKLIEIATRELTKGACFGEAAAKKFREERIVRILEVEISKMQFLENKSQ